MIKQSQVGVTCSKNDNGVDEGSAKKSVTILNTNTESQAGEKRSKNGNIDAGMRKIHRNP
jgi:hypothetical protein